MPDPVTPDPQLVVDALRALMGDTATSVQPPYSDTRSSAQSWYSKRAEAALPHAEALADHIEKLEAVVEAARSLGGIWDAIDATEGNDSAPGVPWNVIEASLTELRRALATLGEEEA